MASRCRPTRRIQFPLAELWTDCELVRGLVRKTAGKLDCQHHMEVTHLVAMANYRANRLACEAADRAMQVYGGIGYTRHMPFEHIYRHHRRYRITEGTEEIQIRKVGYELFSRSCAPLPRAPPRSSSSSAVLLPLSAPPSPCPRAPLSPPSLLRRALPLLPPSSPPPPLLPPPSPLPLPGLASPPCTRRGRSRPAGRPI